MGRYIRLQQLVFLQQVVHGSQVFAVILRRQQGLHLEGKQGRGDVTVWCPVGMRHSGCSGKSTVPCCLARSLASCKPVNPKLCCHSDSACISPCGLSPSPFLLIKFRLESLELAISQLKAGSRCPRGGSRVNCGAISLREPRRRTESAAAAEIKARGCLV